MEDAVVAEEAAMEEAVVVEWEGAMEEAVVVEWEGAERSPDGFVICCYSSNQQHITSCKQLYGVTAGCTLPTSAAHHCKLRVEHCSKCQTTQPFQAALLE